MSEPQEMTAFARASEAAKNGRLDEAETLLAAVLVETPKDAKAQTLSFAIAMQRNDFVLARKRAEAALTLMPDDPSTLSNLGAALIQSNDHATAMSHLNAALEADPNHFFARRNRGMLNAALGRHAEAVEDIKVAVAAQPNRGDTRIALADALIESGQLDEATTVIQEAAKLNIGSQVERTFFWGRLMFRMNRFPEARQAFSAVLSADASEMKHYRALAAASFHCGDSLHAEKVTAGAYRKFPSFERGSGASDCRVLVLEPMGLDFFTDIGRHPVNYITGNFPAYLPIERITYTHAIADTGCDLNDALDMSQYDVAINNRPVFERVDARRQAEGYKNWVSELPMPVVNTPAAVSMMTREANAKRFADAENFVFPRTVGATHKTNIDATHEHILAHTRFPIILRPRHTHVGHGVMLINDEDGLREVLRQNPVSNFYAIDYHDCASPDEMFRRYRLACVGGRLIPDGMRADFKWNVHSWDHGPEKWSELDLDKEEKAFWENPEELLGAPPEEFFRDIVDATELDIYGIDFGFRKKDGRVIVYEVNSAMAIANGGDLVRFPYRIPQCDHIKGLITDLLFEKAGKTAA
jgi:tetratricopeptide (TPR) repeat protein